MKELVAVPIPNLVSGVSQQPPALRLASSCSELINGWPSVVTGLSKRPPTEHISWLSTSNDTNAAVHMIDRDGDYRFIVSVAGGALRVHDLFGNEKTVKFPHGSSYLQQAWNPSEDLRFVTLADTTFILNRRVVAQKHNYGEIGEHNFTPTGTVQDASELPAIAGQAGGSIWYARNQDRYYQAIEQAAQPEQHGWVYQGEQATPYNVPYGGGEGGGSLPDPAGYAVGAQIQTYSYTLVSVPTYHTYYDEAYAGHVTVEHASQYYTYVYKLWRKAVTQAASGSYKWWKPLDEAELSKSVFGRRSPHGAGTVHVTQSVANNNYSIYVNGILYAHYLTPQGVDAATSVPGTDTIAHELQADLTANGVLTNRYGSTICFLNMPPGTTIMGTSGQGDKALRTYTTTVNQFSDLPPNEIQGRIVKIKGSVKDNGDDYYVVYKGNVWIETNAWNSGEGPYAHTMPHVLVRNSDGTWTFKPHLWAGRAVGDEDSNPSPSFYGEYIQDMFLYANRLGFLATENVILSEAGDLENFYRTTMPTIVDSDPIDMAVLNAGSDILYHAIPFNKDVLLMSDRNQYRMSYANYLGPKSVQIQYSTSFAVSRTIKPVNTGGSVYFVDDKPGYNWSKLWEYFPRETQAGDDAEDVTAPVPEYVKAQIDWMASSPRLKVNLLHSKLEPNTIFTYKYYWGGERKVQNAWGKWTFPGCQDILWGGFSGNWLYLIMLRNGGITFERMRCDESVSRQDINSRILLDRQLMKNQLTMRYDRSTDTTSVALPYATNINPEIIASWYQGTAEQQIHDMRLPVTKVDARNYYVPGNITTADVVVCGLLYPFMYRFSTPYLRQQKGTGEVVILDGQRLQLRYMSIEYRETAFFTTLLKYPGREPVKTVFNGTITGDASFIVGRTPFVNGKFRVPLVGNNKDCTLEIHNDSPFNCSFGAAEWTCVFMPKASVRM